ncbi:MAG: hypothetical protein ACI92G_001691 [Candidatus Pelagisphaera sp.]|jgi:hypothetical protein
MIGLRKLAPCLLASSNFKRLKEELVRYARDQAELVLAGTSPQPVLRIKSEPLISYQQRSIAALYRLHLV